MIIHNATLPLSLRATLYLCQLLFLAACYHTAAFTHTISFHLLAAGAIRVRVVAPAVCNLIVSDPLLSENGTDAAFPQTPTTTKNRHQCK